MNTIPVNTAPVDTIVERTLQTKVYTAADGHAVIEQPGGSSVKLSAEEILTVIRELRVCYDYCAAWKEPGTKSQP